MSTFLIIFGVVLLFLGIGKNMSSHSADSGSCSDSDLASRTAKALEDISRERAERYARYETLLKELSRYPLESTTRAGKYLIVDTETTGLPKRRNAEVEDIQNWPRVVQVAWMLVDEQGLLVDDDCLIVRNKGVVPKAAEDVHGISTEKMRTEGVAPSEAYAKLMEQARNAEYIVMHNVDFDLPVLAADMLRHKLEGLSEEFQAKRFVCTMRAGRDECRIDNGRGGYKYPKLTELFGHLYFNDTDVPIGGMHSADADVLVTYRCFMKLKEKNKVSC